MAPAPACAFRSRGDRAPSRIMRCVFRILGTILADFPEHLGPYLVAVSGNGFSDGCKLCGGFLSGLSRSFCRA